MYYEFVNGELAPPTANLEELSPNNHKTVVDATNE